MCHTNTAMYFEKEKKSFSETKIYILIEMQFVSQQNQLFNAIQHITTV